MKAKRIIWGYLRHSTRSDEYGGRYWIWTSDFLRVKQAFSPWTKRPLLNLFYRTFLKCQPYNCIKIRDRVRFKSPIIIPSFPCLRAIALHLPARSRFGEGRARRRENRNPDRKNWIPPYQVRGRLIRSGMTKYVKSFMKHYPKYLSNNFHWKVLISRLAPFSFCKARIPQMMQTERGSNFSIPFVSCMVGFINNFGLRLLTNRYRSRQTE